MALGPSVRATEDPLMLGAERRLKIDTRIRVWKREISVFEVKHDELWKLLEVEKARAAEMLELSSGKEGLVGRVEWPGVHAEQEEEPFIIPLTCGPERRRSCCLTCEGWIKHLKLDSESSLSRMFTGYDDPENTEVYEDELYPEESSSEQSVDSEVEFHLYSQIHYSQDLGETSTLEMDEEADAGEAMSQSSGLTEKQDKDEKLTELSGGGIQLPDEPEVIILSDTPDEDSIYKSKARRSRCSSAQGGVHIPPVPSTPNHTKAAGCNAPCPPESGKGTPRQRNSTIGRPTPTCSAGPQAIHDVLFIDNSSEEESLSSDSDNVESWMLLGAGVDDRDGDIMLNLEGCGTPVHRG
ncbi:hypothetical protein DUI87_15122 [Hirundo rustica rustica]|uniref:Uncharacterized protein n=1 Tax=Hirundo rustica rustica TaxID=333673 RepID=A0A3M0K6E0_HIRRU|nr:hypothetical protein DUI87_15122 [Hirundo rustica rustica]